MPQPRHLSDRTGPSKLSHTNGYSIFNTPVPFQAGSNTIICDMGQDRDLEEKDRSALYLEPHVSIDQSAINVN